MFTHIIQDDKILKVGTHFILAASLNYVNYVLSCESVVQRICLCFMQ
jgi:hypothetical protein